MDNKTINEIAAQIAQNYETAEVPMYGQRLCLPDRASVIAILELLQKLLFPAYFGDTQLLRLPPAQYSALLLQELAEKLTEQIARATGACTDDSAADAANQLLQQLPEIQQLLLQGPDRQLRRRPGRGLQQGRGPALLPRHVRHLRLPHRARAV